MHCIIAADNSPTKPASPVGVQGYAVNSPVGTIIPAEWHNSVQDELITAMSLKGLTPDPSNDAQLAELLAPSVQVIEGNNDATPLPTTTVLQRAVIAAEDCVAGSNTGAQKAFCAASINSAARGNFSATFASQHVAASADLSFVGACSAPGPTRVDIITGTGSAALALRQLTAGAALSGGYCFAGGALDIWLREDRGAAFAAQDIDINGLESIAVASRHVAIGPDFNTTHCAAVGVLGISAAERMTFGEPGLPAVACAAFGVDDTGGTATVISGTANFVAASGSVHMQGGNGATRSAALGVGGGVIAGPENVALATNGVYIDSSGSAVIGGSGQTIDGGPKSTVLGGENNTVSKSNSHILGSEECEVDAAGARSRLTILGSRFVRASLSAAAADYQIMGGVNGSAGAPKWRLDSTNGQLRSTMAAATGGVDYAEYFPNGDGAAHPPGRLLTRVKRSVCLGAPGKRPLGVVSVWPSVVGGDDGLGWARRHATDEWGAPIFEDVELEPGRSVRIQATNPAYDPTKAEAHVPRSARPDQWTCVGLIGQLRLAVEEDVGVDDFICCGTDGLGRRPETETRIEVMDIEAPYDPSVGYARALVLVR